MDRFKRTLAGLSVGAMLMAQGAVAIAYNDVPSGAWFEEAVNDFVAAGYLDASQTRFRPGDNGLRAEFIKLVVELNGGILGTAPAVPSFNDVPVGAWYYGYMEEAAAEGWVRGDGNCYGTSPCYGRPGANINRAEAAALIVRSFGLMGSGDAPQFVDNPSGQWYTDVIQTAADNCVLQGDDGRGTVRPGDNMNRAEMVVMLQRVDMGLMYGDCGTSSSTPTGAAGIDSVNNRVSSSKIEVEFTQPVDRAMAEDRANYDVDGLVVGSVKLTSSNVVELTFESAMVPGASYTLYVTGMTSGGDEFEDSATFSGYNPITPSSGNLEVSLNPNSPMGDTVPKGAIGIAFLSVDFTASCADSIQVEGLTLIHEGQGDEADINNTWMSVNGARVSRTRVFDSEDQTADLRFSRPLLIEPCETVTVDFMADFKTTAATNGRHNYVVELASDILSNAQQVTGTFPIRGETFESAAVSSGVVGVTYRSVTPNQIDVNDKDAVVGKWEFSVDSVEDQTFYSVTLENQGTASDGDFVNIYVQRTDGTPLTDTVTQSVADYVTMTFDPPFTVLEGDKITLEAIADITDGAADTIKMAFEEANDVFAVGSLYGYGVNGQLYGSQININTTPVVSLVTISAGELTIDIDGPVTDEYTPDADDIVLANVDFVTGGEDVNVNEMYALLLGETLTGGTLTCNGSASDTIAENVEDVEIRNTVTGQTVDGVLISTDAGTKTTTTCVASNNLNSTTAIYRFDDFILRDSSRWELRMDFVSDVPTNGDRFRAFICTADEGADSSPCDFGGLVAASETYNFDAEGLSTGDAVDDVRPGEDVAGNYMQVATATLTLTERTLGVNDTVVENAEDVTLFRFEATAGKAEDIFLTQIVVKADTGSLVDGQDYTLWVDSDDDGSVDTILESGLGCEGSCNGSVPAADSVTFDELAGGGYTIPAEETIMFEVHADISGSLKTTTAMRDVLSLGFNDNNGVATTFGFIEGEEADDGTALSCISVGGVASTTASCTATNSQISVTTATSKVYKLRNQGSLYVTKDSVPARSRQLLAGELSDALLRLELRAEDEPIDVTRLIFTTSGALTASNVVNRLKLYRDGESTAFASATIDNCSGISGLPAANTHFCAVMESQQLVIPEGVRTDVLVRAQMKSDEEGALQVAGTFDGLRLFVEDLENVNGIQAVALNANNTSGSGSVTARGFASSNALFFPNTNTLQEGEVFIGVTSPGTTSRITGNANDVVLAKIVTIEDVNPNSDNTNVPFGNDKPVAYFKFTAAQNNNTLNSRNKASISGIVLQVSATNVSFDNTSFRLYNSNDVTQKIVCDAHETNGTLVTGAGTGTKLVSCFALDNTSVDMSMDSGESITLVLELDITDNQVVSTAGSSLSVSMTKFADRTVSTFGPTSAKSHIQWTDSAEDAAPVYFNWIEYGQTQVTSTSYRI